MALTQNSLTYYEILGVHPSASNKEIRKAYKELLRIVHPDVLGNPSDTSRFIEINEAFSVLSDDDRRRAYDEQLSDEQRAAAMRNRKRSRGCLGSLMLWLAVIALAAAAVWVSTNDYARQQIAQRFGIGQLEVTADPFSQGIATAIGCDDSMKLGLLSFYDGSNFYVDGIVASGLAESCNTHTLTVYISLDSSESGAYNAGDIVVCSSHMTGLSGSNNEVRFGPDSRCAIQGTSKMVALSDVRAKDVSSRVGGLAVELRD